MSHCLALYHLLWLSPHLMGLYLRHGSTCMIRHVHLHLLLLLMMGAAIQITKCSSHFKVVSVNIDIDYTTSDPPGLS